MSGPEACETRSSSPPPSSPPPTPSAPSTRCPNNTVSGVFSVLKDLFDLEEDEHAPEEFPVPAIRKAVTTVTRTRVARFVPKPRRVPTINHVNASFKLDKLHSGDVLWARLEHLNRLHERLDGETVGVKFKTNFAVVNTTLYKAVVFRSGHVNVCRIHSPVQVCKAVKDVVLLIAGPCGRVSNFAVNNISASGALGKTVSLTAPKIQRKAFHCRNVCSYTFNPEKFAGAAIRTNTGTALVFSNGHVICVGSRSQRDMEATFRTVDGFFSKPEEKLD